MSCNFNNSKNFVTLTSTRLSFGEDDSDAFKHVGVLAALFIHMFAFVGLDNKLCMYTAHLYIDNNISYVYGAVHHLDSWVKRKPTWCHLFYYFIQCSFNAQHDSAVNTTILRSLRLIGCYFMGCIWFGVCWRSVSVWLWRCGVFMQSEAVVLQTA